MSDAILKARLAVARARAAVELIKAKKISGGAYNRFPAGSSKGGQFAPKGTNSFGNPAAPAPLKGGSNTFHEVGGPGWGHYAKPKAPPRGAKPHPAGVNDKGQPVHINYPTKPSGKDTWADKNKTATFVPGGDAPAKLNGVALKSWRPPAEGWHAVGGNNERLEALFPFTPPKEGKSTGAGVLIMEKDGRIWLTKPTNEFGGYKQTYPKGTVETGLTMQQNAIKEAWEETGLKIKITGVLGDYDRTTSRARMYLAERVGGTPKDMGWESQAVRLATMKDAKTLLNMSHDKAILDDLQALMDITKAAGGKGGGHWQNQARWPAGTALGGQWKAMGADGLTMPPLIAGGLEGKNAAYQKAVNAAYAGAQKGDLAPVKLLIGKYIAKADAFAAGQKGSSHIKWGAQATQYGIALLADASAKPKAEAIADKLNGPEKLFSMMKTGGKPGGSNPGGMFVDKSGQQWLVKGSNAALSQDAKTIEDRSKNEVLAAKLMLAAGVGAPDMKLVDLEGQFNGGLGVASKWVDGLKPLSTHNLGDLGAARADFAVHAWLANYDALGMGLDNTMIKDGKAINIDTGGALLFRAQGAKKGPEHGVKDGLLDPSAPEFESMRKTSAEQKAVYGKMTASDLKASAEKLNNISDATITDLVKSYGPGDDAFKAKLAENLIARKNAILAKAGLTAPAGAPAAEKPALKPHTQHELKMPTGALAKAPIGAKGLSKSYTLQGIVALKAGNLQKLEEAKAAFDKQLSAFKDMGVASKMMPGYTKVQQFLDAAIKEVKAGGSQPAATTTPKPTSAQVEAALLATAMKEVNTSTTAMKNKLANYPDYEVKGPSENAVSLMQKAGGSAALANIAEAMDKAYLAGDISGLAMAKVGADVLMKASPDIKEKDDASSLVVFGIVGMNKLSYDAVKASQKIADAAPTVNIPPKPVFPFGKTGSAYYSKLVEQAEKAVTSGDLDALKAVAVNKYGKPAWPTNTANGKVMEAYHAGLVAQLEQKEAAVVVARVQQAAKALEEKATPKPEAEKPAASVALPDFESKKLPSGTNAASHNAKVDQIKALAEAGDVNGLLSLKYGTNTYGKKHVALANDVLKALGSPHVVTAGQDKNSHPALFGGVTAAQATAAAATVNVPPPPPHPATELKAGAKGKPVFKPENLTTPPDFTNWNGTGKGLSSKDYINTANNEAANLIFQTAQKGDALALAQLTYKAVNKETGAVEGTKLMKDHPSQHVIAYQSTLIQQIDLQLNPPKMPRLGVVTSGTLDEVSKALVTVPAGKTVAAVPQNQKAGKYIVLGKASQIVDPPKADDSVVSSAAWKASATDHYKAAPQDAKDTFSLYVTTSGARALNSALRDGNLTKVVGGKTVKQHVENFNKLLVDVPEGTTFTRNMGKSGYGDTPDDKLLAQLQQFLLTAEKGTVVQEPGFSSSSWGKEILGNNDFKWKFTAAKGVKTFPAWLGANVGEGESLFPPNQRYMIMGAKKVGKTVVVDAILLPYENPLGGGKE